MRRCGRQKGQATVELALSSIVLLLIVTGLLDLARVFYFDVTLQGAVREGARHASWYNTSLRVNPYLSDSEVLAAVNTSLAGAGLPLATANAGAGNGSCISGSGTGSQNPPYSSSAYSAITATNTPVLYICYTKPDGTQKSTLAAAPADNSYRMGDVNVILLMNYGLITFFLQNQIGPSFNIAANSHFTIQGRP